ncbi:Bro-N domain-containing protein [Ruthenibacterium lactatiformans]|uniref:BRO-N domain-containing protein n=1 Tax=Ruthenibacterium lactatiformans TaxID=1550024 RepID=UPI0022E5DE86|nr:BRO family protein [Ruthenibacterium lactatiformans]
MNELKIFAYSGEELRTIQREDGLWWVLRDVCRVLGMTTPAKVAERLDDDEKGVSLIHTLGGNQKVTIINEPGLYAVILRSDKPEAKAFKRWVTHDVLPTIRRTGTYGVLQKQLDRLSAAQQMLADWRRMTAEWEEMTSAACQRYDSARKHYDNCRAARDACRKYARDAQAHVDALVEDITARQ